MSSTIIKAVQTGMGVNTLNTTNEWVLGYDVSGFNSIVPQVSSVNASWPVGIQVDMEISNDGLSWSAFSTAQQYTSDGIKTKLDIQNIRYVRARLSWTSNSGIIRVILYGSNDA